MSGSIRETVGLLLVGLLEDNCPAHRWIRTAKVGASGQKLSLEDNGQAKLYSTIHWQLRF